MCNHNSQETLSIWTFLNESCKSRLEEKKKKNTILLITSLPKENIFSPHSLMDVAASWTIGNFFFNACCVFKNSALNNAHFKRVFDWHNKKQPTIWYNVTVALVNSHTWEVHISKCEICLFRENSHYVFIRGNHMENYSNKGMQLWNEYSKSVFRKYANAMLCRCSYSFIAGKFTVMWLYIFENMHSCIWRFS